MKVLITRFCAGFIAVAGLIQLNGCDDSATPATETDTTAGADVATAPDGGFGFTRPGPPVVRLDPRRRLIRMSLDLRGFRPDAAEYRRLLDAPDAAAAEAVLAELRETFLASPHFERRVRDLWAPHLRTRTDELPVSAAALGVAPDKTATFAASVGEEPLMLLSHAAANDLPLTVLATADYTFVDEHLAAVYPTDDTGTTTGWRQARYSDGRPHAGWLSMNGLWWRYLSDGISYARGRANAIARVFLCSDFLDRPVDFPRDIDLTDETAIRAAIRDNRGCIGCHASLDPLAGYLAGFHYQARTPAEMLRYHPERERQWPRLAGLAPAFYGVPGFALTDLGRQLAADPRFIGCLVATGRAALMGPHDPFDADALDALTAHRERLLAGGLTMKALMRSLLDDVSYADAARERLVSPQQWSATLAALTGYTVMVEGVDLFATDRGGLRTLAGGADGRTGGAAATTATVPMLLTWERTAEAAALFALETGGAGEKLVPLAVRERVPETEAVEDEVMREVVAGLHLQLFGVVVAPDAALPEIGEPLRLWQRAHEFEKSPKRAWAAVLTAMLLDPTMFVY